VTSCEARAASACCGGAWPDEASVAVSASSTTCDLRRGQVWMLTIYAKNEAAAIPGPVLKRIKEEIDGIE
jgi:hypothetical protein